MTELLRRYREAGISRVMGLVPGSVEGDAALTKFAESAVQAGCVLAS